MRRRTKILMGAGVAVVVAIIVCSTTSRPVSHEPTFNGRPISQWIDGAGLQQGASVHDVNRALYSMDSNAVPWLIWRLEKNSRRFYDRLLLRGELQLGRYKNGYLVTNRLAKLVDKDQRRSTALALLSQYAPGTCFEENAARAVLQSKSPLSDFDQDRAFALGCFTNCPDLVVPALCAALTNRVTFEASVYSLSRFGPRAVPNVYSIALAGPGTNAATAALYYLDRTAWTNLGEEKQTRSPR